MIAHFSNNLFKAGFSFPCQKKFLFLFYLFFIFIISGGMYQLIFNPEMLTITKNKFNDLYLELWAYSLFSQTLSEFLFLLILFSIVIFTFFQIHSSLNIKQTNCRKVFNMILFSISLFVSFYLISTLFSRKNGIYDQTYIQKDATRLINYEIENIAPSYRTIVDL
ncbi:hypothetical protein TRFO_38179 [Tritrichomonas foetus]|uniref:Uncharacterized protein n=1 Tax=Tritrichomonas foetus TaxID=1144522 RepID=A0A1J4JAH9_9EUKA|nr:hypothetical protein TRFO_38179 [Tritrichomonas foetus]|eukprot:OHS95673.1 hypothetical protein TRFO_38179 [Tritrichomonas foetus]